MTKRDVPTQRISEAPFGQGDSTGAYVAAARKEFKECLKQIFLKIAQQAYDRKPGDLSQITQQALECRTRYFQAMKGATNVGETAIRELVRREYERQVRFHEKLRKIQERFGKMTGSWTHCVLHPPHTVDTGHGWDTGLTVGCDITVGSTTLFAFPLVQARTATYRKGEEVLFVDEDCVIARPYPLPAAVQPFQFEEVWSEEFGSSGAAPVRNLGGDFPHAKKAMAFSSFLLLDSEETFSNKELAVLCEKYGVLAIVKANSINRQAFIYTGREDFPLHVRSELLKL
jgi:hypothetical protein